MQAYDFTLQYCLNLSIPRSLLRGQNHWGFPKGEKRSSRPFGRGRGLQPAHDLNLIF